MTRIQVINDEHNTILGLPIEMALKPNLICVYNINTKIIDYYPMNNDFKLDELYIVSRIKLRYHLEPLLEFADINDRLKLLDREKEIIENIQNCPLIDLTSYDVLHKSYSVWSV